MNMDKIFEMLGITKLDEENQNKLKVELEAIIEAKATEKAEELVKVEKVKLVEEMETKFENYKEDITSKFSNFLDDILDEELIIPENILEYAKIGEEYKPLIESFKVKLAIDEGVLDNEVKALLKEAKDEIVKLTSEKDELTNVKLDLEVKNSKMTNENYLLTKCDGLVPAQKAKIMSVLEGASKEEVDKKFDILVKLNEASDEFETKTCPECGKDVPEDAKVCPECDYKFDDTKVDDKDDDLELKGKDKEKAFEGKGKSEADDKKKVNENDPKTAWLKILNEKRI